MFFDVSSFSNAGGAILGVAAYAGLSIFITGPLIGDRMIERLGWSERCPDLLRAETQRSQPRPQVTPSLNCAALGSLLGPDGSRLCGLVNPLIRGDFIDYGKNELRAFQDKRIERAAGQSAGRCECAATLAIGELQSDLALHAGTLRLVTPRSVRTLENTLHGTLDAPICARKG